MSGGNFTGYIGNRFNSRQQIPNNAVAGNLTHHQLLNQQQNPMSKDQITAHIASSLGLCPIKDYKTMAHDLAGNVSGSQQQGLLKPAPIRPNYHTNGPLPNNGSLPGGSYAMSDTTDPWIYSNSTGVANNIGVSNSHGIASNVTPVGGGGGGQNLFPNQQFSGYQNQSLSQSMYGSLPNNQYPNQVASQFVPVSQSQLYQQQRIQTTPNPLQGQGGGLSQQGFVQPSARGRIDSGFYLQPTSSYPNVPGANLSNQMLGGGPNAAATLLGGNNPGVPQSWNSAPGLETDADMRFRRSKELFEQAQRTHQQIRNTQQEQVRLQQQQQQMFYNQQPPPPVPQNAANYNTNKFYDSTLSYVNPSMQNSVVRGPPTVNTAISNDILHNYKSTADNKQSWFRNQKSKSFDQEDLMYANQNNYTLPAQGIHSNSMNPSVNGPQFSTLQSTGYPSQVQPGGVSSMHQHSNSLSTVDYIPQATVQPDLQNSNSFSIPVDLAYKLHSSHHGRPGSKTGRDLVDGPGFMSMHELHASHAPHSDFSRNKSVSFNIPSQFSQEAYENDDVSKVAQMFPNCIECQKAEENRILYRQALRIRKNNSDKTLNEYMKMGGPERYSTGNTLEDERLKDLAQLISKTFSERLFQEERDLSFTVPPPPGSARAQARKDDYLPVHYNSAGQKIPHKRLPLDPYYDEELPPYGGATDFTSGRFARGTSRSRKLSSHRSFDYDSVPAYKDSTQYLALEGVNMRNTRGNSRTGTGQRTSRTGTTGADYNNGTGISSSNRHSAYASDMDTYLYDRERYGSVNLAKFHDSKDVDLSPHDPRVTGTGGKRQNLKDIRYSRDYEFVPKSEDLYGTGGGGAPGHRRSRGHSGVSSDRGHSPSDDPRYLPELPASNNRRSSPRERQEDMSLGYPRNSNSHSSSSSHRRTRSSSVREDIDGGNYHGRDNDINYETQSSRRHGSKSRHQNSSNASGAGYNNSYNFVEDREQRRRGSSSESIDRMSSPDRHHRGQQQRHYSDDKHGTGSRRGPSYRDENNGGGGGGGGGGGRGSRNNHDSIQSNHHSVKDGNVNSNVGVERQKLSEVPPNHSTESGYSSQSQHTGGSREDRRRNGDGGGQPLRGDHVSAPSVNHVQDSIPSRPKER